MTRLLLTLLALTACSPTVGGGDTAPSTPRDVSVAPAGNPFASHATPERATRAHVRAPQVLTGARPTVSPTPTKRPGKARTSASGWHNIADVIADCESGKRLANGRALTGSYNLRGNDPNSSASGKYSFIDSTWEWVTGLPAPASRYSEAVQDAAFRKLWADGRGASHWAPSRSCWGWAR